MSCLEAQLQLPSKSAAEEKAITNCDMYLFRVAANTPLNEVLLYSELHEHFLSVPEPIRLYIEEVKTQLLMLTNYNGPSMTLKEKWEFIKLTRHAFGRTALVLSGGGALGAFHLVRPIGLGLFCT